MALPLPLPVPLDGVLMMSFKLDELGLAFFISNIDCKAMMPKVLLKDRGKMLHQNMD